MLAGGNTLRLREASAERGCAFAKLQRSEAAPSRSFRFRYSFSERGQRSEATPSRSFRFPSVAIGLQQGRLSRLVVKKKDKTNQPESYLCFLITLHKTCLPNGKF